MKQLAIVALVIAGLYFYFAWKPSTESIATNISVGEQIEYDGHIYSTVWGDTSEVIAGDVRRIDRHYDENMPIITYDLVITTGQYSDPDIVTVRHKGGGNYYWSAKVQPKGSIHFYHTIPADIGVQKQLDTLSEGGSIKIQARISRNSEIKSDTGAFVKLMHANHSFILVEEIQ